MKAKKEKSLEQVESTVNKEKRAKTKRIAGSVIVSIIVWLVFLYIANSILNESKHVQVYRARVDIEDGTKLTTANLSDMVEQYSISEDLLPDGYITDEAELVDVFTNRSYKAREVITRDGVSTEESMTKHIENPIEISVAVSSIDAAVGGILREGDYINIYSINGKVQSASATLMVSNAYITKALDANGVELSRTDKESTATVINLIIPMSIEERFNKELVAGTIRMSLVYNPDIENVDNALHEEEEEVTEEAESNDEDNELVLETATESQWVGDVIENTEVYAVPEETEDTEQPSEVEE